MWLTVEAAAEALGVSERTVWRRVKAGALAIDRGVTPHLVEVSDSGVPESAKVSQLSELRGEVTRLQAEVEKLEGERDYLRSALATALTTQQRLLTYVKAEGERDDRGPETFGEWLRRLLGRGGR